MTVSLFDTIILALLEMMMNDYKNLTAESASSRFATVSAEELIQAGGPPPPISVPPSMEPTDSRSTFHCNIDQEVSGMPNLTENPLGWA